MKLPSPSFCVMPFGHLFLSEEGKSFPCCYALETGAVNRDESGEPIAVRSGSDIERAWNSVSQRQIRKQMLDGEKPAACRRCFELESHGMRSLREVNNQGFLQDTLTTLESVQPNGSMPPKFFSVDLRLGNLCNLRCQMCSPVSSLKLAEDFHRIYPEAKENFAAKAKINWHKDAALLAEIFRQADFLKEAHFAGGEPFLIPEVALAVEALAKRVDAREITLSFNTNCTVLPEKFLRLFPRFKGVRLIISIDGLNEVNDYIRYPSKFLEIEKNLKLLHSNREAWNLSLVAFNITVQTHNLFQIPELVNYLAANYPAFLPFPVLGALNVPECLSIKVLPANVKAAARAKISEFIRDGIPIWAEWEKRVKDRSAEKFAQEVSGILEFMDAEDRSDLLPEFRRFSGVIEQIRGQKLAVPGL
jgi:sulfatase maturation enzyme AslB (radical SAM superfamily)